MPHLYSEVLKRKRKRLLLNEMGDWEEGRKTKLLKRFEARFKKLESGCWEWNRKNDNGYGVFFFENFIELAHRLSYVLFKKIPIPDNMTVDHLCRNRRCINPEHLEVVTHKVNILRGVGITAINAKKTHCLNGHKFTKKNTYYFNGRHCMRCRADKSLKIYHEKRQAILDKLK